MSIVEELSDTSFTDPLQLHISRPRKRNPRDGQMVKFEKFQALFLEHPSSCGESYREHLIKVFPSTQSSEVNSNKISISYYEIINKAISSTNGRANFYETSLEGNGSLLEIGELSKKSYGSSQEEKFLAETTTLDTFYKNKDLDILWIDVQGAEKLVLQGAKETLKKIKAVFIEISIKNDLYLKSVTMEELDEILLGNGFKLVLLGTDFNLTGNALYIK